MGIERRRPGIEAQILSRALFQNLNGADAHGEVGRGQQGDERGGGIGVQRENRLAERFASRGVAQLPHEAGPVVGLERPGG